MKWFYAHLPGMEGFRTGTNESGLMKLITRHQLTHQLMRVTKPVSHECVLALQDVYTNNEGKCSTFRKGCELNMIQTGTKSL